MLEEARTVASGVDERQQVADQVVNRLSKLFESIEVPDARELIDRIGTGKKQPKTDAA